ncbi:monofunctional biosynthetic peptidoglycan transglycosylase [Rhodobacteraceae bacterium 63075]|nr:monofunctional biosynthetic peptidoglycan transglycosylase [Rhodobacteraceae bacterium 63075]
MAKKKTKSKTKARKLRPLRWLKRWLLRFVLLVSVLVVGVVAVHSILNPTKGIYMRQEARRLGVIDQHWVPIEGVAPVMARSVVAAEDANFCIHWGFDMNAIRKALEDGGRRGASTLSQQVVKNTYLWLGRNWSRKALEALITPLVELFWSKRRILEVYLNVAEFDEGIFGIEAASQHYFGIPPSKLTAVQAARLAAILPAPKDRSASRPSSYVRKRAAQIRDGAETIRRDGRADCFES